VDRHAEREPLGDQVSIQLFAMSNPAFPVAKTLR